MQGTEGQRTPGGFQIVPGSFACLPLSVSIKIQRLIRLISILFLVKPFNKMCSVL